MSAEIFAVGDELCYGRVYDTNSFWLADQVTKLGLIVNRITCVRDDIEELCSALGESLSRCPRFIFITGGLGPTVDDKTIEAISKLVGRKIVIEYNILREMAERRGVDADSLSPGLKAMARTVEGAECLPNPIGWAPVTILSIGKTQVAALPGPPKEMQGCFVTHLSKRIADATGYRSLSNRIYVTMYESEISPVLETISRTFDGVYFKPLISEYKQGIGMPIEIIVFGESEVKFEERYSELLYSLKQEIIARGKNIVIEPNG
ncbi:MAG: competence/damage-inducible protein A [Thermoproteota archaeon]